MNFAVVTLQDTDEVMVVASEWLSTDKKRCYWPPFKSTEKYLEAVKSNLEPSTGGKPWDILNVIFHAEYGNAVCTKIIFFSCYAHGGQRFVVPPSN